MKNTLNQKIEEYLERAEDIKQYLQQHAEEEQHSPNAADGSEKAAKKRKEHNGNNGNNPLDEHLRTALESTTIQCFHLNKCNLIIIAQLRYSKKNLT